jgi:hypothetical protein
LNASGIKVVKETVLMLVKPDDNSDSMLAAHFTLQQKHLLPEQKFLQERGIPDFPGQRATDIERRY